MRYLAFVAMLLASLGPSSAAAQEATPSPSEDGVLVRVEGSDRVDAGETLAVAVVVDGDLVVDGTVREVIVVVNGELTVANGGRVDGSIIVVDGRLVMRDGSRVTADVFLPGDSEWILEEGARFTGTVDPDTTIDSSTAWQMVLGTFIVWIGMTLLLVGAAIVFAGIGGRQLWSTARNLSSRPGATVLTTICFWLGISLVAVPLILSGVGVLALPGLIILATVVWFLGYIAFATRLGSSLSGRRIRDTEIAHPYLPSVAGTLILQLVLLIALAGGLATVLSALLPDEPGNLGLVFAIPAIILQFVLFVAGLLGGGALVLRGLEAWSSRN